MKTPDSIKRLSLINECLSDIRKNLIDESLKYIKSGSFVIVELAPPQGDPGFGGGGVKPGRKPRPKNPRPNPPDTNPPPIPPTNPNPPQPGGTGPPPPPK